MSGNLLSVLRTEERQLLAELRATPIFQKLEAIRRVLGLYSTGATGDEPPAEDLLLSRADPAAPAEAAAREPAPPARGAAPAAEARAPQPRAAEPVPAASAPIAPTTPAPLASAQRGTPVAAPANTPGGPPGVSAFTIAEPTPEQLLRDGSRAVSAVRAALLAVTR